MKVVTRKYLRALGLGILAVYLPILSGLAPGITSADSFVDGLFFAALSPGISVLILEDNYLDLISIERWPEWVQLICAGLISAIILTGLTLLGTQNRRWLIVAIVFGLCIGFSVVYLFNQPE